MTVLAVVSGPDRAGKSTFISTLAEHLSALRMIPDLPAGAELMAVRHSCVSRIGKVLVRHWYEPVDSHRDFYTGLMADSVTHYPVLWDRSWACDAVYSSIFDRPGHVLATDPWYGEWIMGRAVQTTGVRIMHLGPDLATLIRRKAEEVDAHVVLDIDQAAERSGFEKYASDFNWRVVTDDASATDAIESVIFKYGAFTGRVMRSDAWLPPTYAGPLDARVLFLGEARNQNDADGWLPFTSHYTTELGRWLGGYAFQCGWTNAADNPHDVCSQARMIVTCGQVALDYYRQGRFTATLFHVPHPSALLRWGKYQESVPELRRQLRQVVAAVV